MNIAAYLSKRRFERSLRIANRKFRTLVETSHYNRMNRQERRNVWRSFWKVFRGPRVEGIEVKSSKKR